MAVPTVMAEFELADDSDAPEHLNIDVTANQYWWHFEYKDEEGEIDVVTSQDLYIPVGEKVYLDLYTNDVVHSFWVPSLAGKLDVNPDNVRSEEHTSELQSRAHLVCRLLLVKKKVRPLAVQTP